MRSRILQVIGLTMILTLASCANVFYTSDCNALAHGHRTIAIIPPTVSFASRYEMDATAIKEEQKTESITFQAEMYSWMLRRKMQNGLFVEIQDISTTNAMLKRAGYPDYVSSAGELCQILGVDGVITSNYALSKPMSEGGAVAMGVLFGVWGANKFSNRIT